MRIARVFPTRTRMTPTDELVFTSFQPPQIGMPEADEVHISVTFTWDLGKAEQMAEAWRVLGVPVKLGGPAFGKPGGDFVPGLYVKEGATITSRGCPNNCPHCGVPAREGGLRELPILDGWNVLDDNLLACSDAHVEAVFQMLERQPYRAEFTGGLEAKLLQPWHARRMREIMTKRMYFAYDEPPDLEPLMAAGKIMRQEGHKFSSHRMACYVLCNFLPGDTIEKAEARVVETIKAGFMPFPMVYRDYSGKREQAWKKWAHDWLQPEPQAMKVNEIIARERITWEG